MKLTLAGFCLFVMTVNKPFTMLKNSASLKTGTCTRNVGKKFWMEEKMYNGKFSCPIDYERYINYDCRECAKYKSHIYFLRRHGYRAICKVAVNLRKIDNLDVT